MGCEHKRIKSVNCVLYCMDCGAVIDPPKAKKPLEGAEQAATEGKEKKPRRTRKGAGK